VQPPGQDIGPPEDEKNQDEDGGIGDLPETNHFY